VALGLNLINYVPGTGAPLAIIVATRWLGLLVATVWAAGLGQPAVAAMLGIFAGFWSSYAALALGLAHNWYGTPAADIVRTVTLFTVTWMVVVAMLSLTTLRVPSSFRAIFFLVELTLALVTAGYINADASLLKAAGVSAFTFGAIGVYVFFDIASQATGGPGSRSGSASSGAANEHSHHDDRH